MSLGQNTVSGEQLRSFVERIERLRGEKKALGADEAAVAAEAKAAGFSVPAIRACVKIRAMKPHDRQEGEAMLDMYLHALGMAMEPPLFRAAGLAGTDIAAREQVVARLKDFVPAFGLGDITVNWGGKAVRLSRGKDGEVVELPLAPPMQTVTEKPAPMARPKSDVPDVTPDGAHELGRQYARDNRPVIDNPFPFGDPRRAKFDEGWRAETGSDGMGPDRGE
jgi:uncharacterized protein (UPF0335 family)